MTILILHGIMGHAGENWGQWLHDELAKAGHTILMPTLPEADHPDRRQWLEAIKSATKGLAAEQLVIVAHSLGVTSVLDYLEQITGTVVGLASVSGFAVDYGLELNSYFLKEKTVDFAKIHDHLKQAAVFYGDNDPYVTQEVLQQLADDLKVEAHVIHDGGHLNATAGFNAFPQLLGVVQDMVS